MAELNNLRPPARSHRDRKRVGRGPGSGKGKTSGYGHKGSKARAGSHGPGGGKQHFEGGQMPLSRRLPKRGFTSLNRVEYQVVNLYQLQSLEENDISPRVLRARGLIGNARRPVKVLGTGKLTRSINVSAHAFSRSAREKIEKVGGRVEELA